MATQLERFQRTLHQLFMLDQAENFKKHSGNTIKPYAAGETSYNIAAEP